MKINSFAMSVGALLLVGAPDEAGAALASSEWSVVETVRDEVGFEERKFRLLASELTDMPTGTEFLTCLGYFYYGAHHQIRIGTAGSGANSSLSCDFKVRWQGVLTVDKLTRNLHQTPLTLESEKADNVGVYLYLRTKKVSPNVWWEVHHTVVHGHGASWRDQAPEPGASSPTALPPARISSDSYMWSTSASNRVDLHAGSISLSGSGTLNNSPIVTEASLGAMTAPSFGSWAETFVIQGNRSSGALLSVGQAGAFGSGAVAVGLAATANGDSTISLGDSTQAIGNHSLALGSSSYAGVAYASAISGGSASAGHAFAANEASASGEWSTAIGGGENLNFSSPNVSSGASSVTIGGVENEASGYGSYALGVFSRGEAASVSVLGAGNVGGGSPTAWVETDPLFEVGNAAYEPTSPSAPTLRSNALTILKNGLTTLTNKAWKENYNQAPENALADPASPDDSEGHALVVEGHSLLKGKVIIAAPQGDISMGIYGD